MKAYRIVNWKRKYEVNKHGKPADEDTTINELRKNPLEYVRHNDNGLLLSHSYRKMVRQAWALGVMFEMAAYGLYMKLLDITKNQKREFRGWILNENHRPLYARELADILDIKDDSDYVKKILILLIEAGWLEYAELPEHIILASKFSPASGNSGEDRIRQSSPISGEFGGGFKIVTEAESDKTKLYETEGTPAPGSSGQDTPCPSSDTGSARVSDISVSVSDFGPPMGRGYLISDIPQFKKRFLAQLCVLIKPRSNSDYTTYSDIGDQLELKMTNETELDLFSLALKKAEDCYRATKPIAMFVAAMKEPPFNYVPRGTLVIRGRKDKYRS